MYDSMVDFVVHRRFPFLKVTASIALMTQIHFIVFCDAGSMMYVPFYLYYFFGQNEKGKALLQLGKSVLLYFVLTANIWRLVLALVYSGNKYCRLS